MDLRRVALSLWACCALLACGDGRRLNGSGPGGGGGDVGDPDTGAVTLTALYAGMQLKSGPPEVRDVVPPDGASGIAPSTPVVVIFSESVDPDTVSGASIGVTADTGGGPFPGVGSPPIAGTVALAPGTSGRVAVLLPAMPLTPGNYRTDVNGVADVEGNALTLGSSGPPGTLPTGNSYSFATLGAPGGGIGGGELPVDFAVQALYPTPGSSNVPADTTILLVFSRPVAEASAKAPGNIEVRAGGQEVAGTVTLDHPHIVRFVPAKKLPLGATVTVTAAAALMSQAIPSQNVPAEALDPVEAFERTFRVTQVPTPVDLGLPGNAPITVAGATFDGTLTSKNVKDFRAEVKLGAGGDADRVTLLFFQPKGGIGASAPAAARAFTEDAASGRTQFKVNLGASGGGAAFADTTASTPPAPLFLGAFAIRGSERSPVGPAELPSVFVKTSKPVVEFGPPTAPADPFEFRTDLARPAIYGSATEPLTQFRAVLNATTAPVTFDAVQLGPLGQVTDAAEFLMTEPGLASDPLQDPFAAPLFVPIEISEVRFTDQVGNEVVKKSPKAGRIAQEGSLGGTLEAGASEALRVRVVRDGSLRPLKNVNVRATKFPYDPLAGGITRSTSEAGEVAFDAGELVGFGTHLMVTAIKGEYDLFTVAGFENPALAAAGIGVSIVLHKVSDDPPLLTVKTKNDIPPQGAGTATEPPFAASAANGAATDPDDAPGSGAAGYDDERFAFADLDITSKKTETTLRAPRNRPLVVAALEHDGLDTYVTGSSPVRVLDADGSLTFDFLKAGGEMLFPTTFANTVVQKADVAAAGIVEDPLLAARARLVARVPGLPGVLPLSLSPVPIDAAGATRTLFAPVPLSLFENEFGEDLDPAYEVLLQPAAATGPAPPTEALLEQSLRLEVEAAEEDSTRLTRHRAVLDFDLTADPPAAPTGEPIAFPHVPDVSAMPQHPPTIVMNAVDVLPADSAYRLTLRAPGSARRWVALVSAEATAIVPPIFSFPDAGVSPFGAAGTFEVVVEAFEFAAGSFDFDRFVFTDVERLHRRLARSATATFTTAP